MQETTFLNANDLYDLGGALPYPPVWELQGAGTVTSESGGREIIPPWFNVRLTFADGARIDVLVVVDDGRVAIEDLRADPPLSLGGFEMLAERIEDLLEDACRVATPPPAPDEPEPDPPCVAEHADPRGPGRRRTRPAVPRGSAGRRMAADAYRAAQQDGRDPVLAVMAASGRSRRKSLRLIAGARDDGYLTPRHNRRRHRS
ncbi:DUF6214 family protein [Streptomyces sp. ISL-1]|uniref:DUF6214 family protein n=1 Tax=Streptomyces sp. ISL-1 TaxID=2817657 RepID=UPI0027E5348B|nr:DUF6214 family protein [Streptomyces sp. ISL-1]